MESHEETTGCQAPEGSILCVNNCGFFGSAATMNMCSKCHKDLLLNRDQSAKLSALLPPPLGPTPASLARDDSSSAAPAPLLRPGPDVGPAAPNRCVTCRKRVGLTGFGCRCGGVFCALHRYSDKHGCPFDYRSAARDSIARANPVVKAEKLDKI